MPVFDPTGEYGEGLSGLIDLPGRRRGLSNAEILEVLLSEDSRGSVELMLSDERQKPLNMNAPPMQFAIGQWDALNGPQAAQPGWGIDGGTAPWTGVG